MGLYLGGDRRGYFLRGFLRPKLRVFWGGGKGETWIVLGRGEYYQRGAFFGSRGKLEIRSRYKAKCHHTIIMSEKRKAVCSGNRYGIDNYQCMGNSRKCCHSLGDNDVMNTPSTLSSLPSVSPTSIPQVLNSFPREELVRWLLLFQSTSYFLPAPKK